ncbi:unnamed protein product, partial [Owenia fusiformis]
FWRRSLDHMVVPMLELCSDRILCVKLVFDDSALFIFSVYLPQQNCHHTTFTETLDILNDFVERISNDGNVVIFGDVNANLGTLQGSHGVGDTQTQSGIELHNFCLSNELWAVDTNRATLGPVHTFEMLRNGNYYRSYIDHIIVSLPLCGNVSECVILDNEPGNTSDHLPIITTFRDLTSVKHVIQRNDCVGYAWNKLSSDEIKSTYTSSLDLQCKGILNDLRLIGVNNLENCQIDSYILKLVNGLIECSNAHIPIKKFSKHVKPFWNDELTRLVKLKKKRWREWVSAGRPRNADNVIRAQYKSAKCAFRKCFRCSEFMYEQNELNRLYRSESLDQRYYWHLLNKSRNRASRRLSPIKSDNDVIVSDEAGIRDEWRTHFARLATPSDKPHFHSHAKCEI